MFNKISQVSNARLLILTALLIISADYRGNAQTSRPSDDIYLIDDFEDDEVGSIPEGWYNRDGSSKVTELAPESRSGYLYRVRSESGGNHYLHYEGIEAKHINYPLINKEGVNIHETPILSWRWRVHDLPEGADEKSNDKNDAAASIYVVFDMANYLIKRLPVSIRYTWSSTLPVGATGSKLLNKQQIKVVASGRDKMGKWVQFERNLLKDYKELHGGKPPEKPIAILILSDGDSVQDSASADYDDIMLKAK